MTYNYSRLFKSNYHWHCENIIYWIVLKSKLKNIDMFTTKFLYIRGESRAAVTSKMECFGIIITKCSILDVAAALNRL